MKRQRPTSPHLQVYKPQLTSVLSITHRITGLGLSVGTLLLCWWLFALNAGEVSYGFFTDQLKTWYGKFLMGGFLFGFYYHLCNGLRHLYWDLGKGYELKSVYRAGWLVLGVSVILTATTIARVF